MDKMLFRYLFAIFLMLQFNLLNAQSINISKYILNSKIGVGSGVNFYIGTSGDGKITLQKNSYTELQNLTDIYLTTKLNPNWDIGLRFASGRFWSQFVNSDVLAFEAQTKDLQLIANREITPIFLRGSNFNLEVLLGLGFANFQSKLYSTDNNASTFNTSIGFNRNETNPNGVVTHFPDSRSTFLFSTGLKLNYHLVGKLDVFLESRINVSSTGLMSGNVYRKSSIPPDSYWSHLVGLEWSFGKSASSSKRIRCPRF